MSETVTAFNNGRYSASLDIQTGYVTCDVTFVMHQAGYPNQIVATDYSAASPTEIPEYIEVENELFHNTSTIKCWQTRRSVEYRGTCEDALVTVTYVGRVNGIYKIDKIDEPFMEQIHHSLKKDTDIASGEEIYPAIGVDGVGVSRIVPSYTRRVMLVLDNTMMENFRTIASALEGTVNEQGWEAPWGETCTEGQYLFRTATEVVDRASQTTEVMLDFWTRKNGLAQRVKWFGYTTSIVPVFKDSKPINIQTTVYDTVPSYGYIYDICNETNPALLFTNLLMGYPDIR